jgi:hypothetical protein
MVKEAGTSAAGSSRSRFTRGKRKADDSDGGDFKISELLAKFRELFRLRKPRFVYHMDKAEERFALIDALWAGEFVEAATEFSAAHPEMVSLFDTLTFHEEDVPSHHSHVLQCRSGASTIECRDAVGTCLSI